MTDKTGVLTSNEKLIDDFAAAVRSEYANSTPYTRRELDETRAALLAERNTIETSDVLDAAKWRALRNCARITAIGSAGMGPERAADDYAHITLNFWTGVPDGDPGPAYAREWLDTFVDKALRGSLKALERRCVCGQASIPEGELRVEIGPTTHRLAGPCFQTSSSGK